MKLRSLLICVLATLLAACGAGNAPSASQATPSAVPAQAATCADGTWLFEHTLLATESVCVPHHPQRIAIADFAALDVMYTLQIPPVAVWGLLTSGWYANMVPELMPSINRYLGDARDLGAIPLNLEALAAAQPDMILINSLLVTEPDMYEQLSAIAPTVVKVESNTDDWREYMRFYGAVLNRTDEVERLLGEYAARLEALRTASGGSFDGQTVSLVQVNDPATLYLNFPSYRGWLPLRDVGFRPSDEQLALMEQAEDDNTPYIAFSNERIDLLETDYVVLMNAAFTQQDASAVEALYESYRNDPLWSTLPAVREGRFYLVDLAWQANGLISAHAVIDDMYRLFLGQEPAIPNPYMDQVDAPEQ